MEDKDLTIDDIVAYGSALDMVNLNFDLQKLHECEIAVNYTITADAIKIIDVSLIPDTPADITNVIRKEI